MISAAAAAEHPQIGDRPFGILIAGVGGTGVVTIGAFLAMAAHLEGKSCGSTDMAGLAQKGGAVHSHIKMAAKPDQIHAISVGTGGADLVIGCDLVVSGSAKVLATVRPGETGVVINNAETSPAISPATPTSRCPSARSGRRSRRPLAATPLCDATSRAIALVGTSVATNVFSSVSPGRRGFCLCRKRADARHRNRRRIRRDEQAGFSLARGRRTGTRRNLTGAKDDPARRARYRNRRRTFQPPPDFLTAYQNRAYADLYAARVKRVIDAEKRVCPGRDAPRDSGGKEPL